MDNSKNTPKKGKSRILGDIEELNNLILNQIHARNDLHSNASKDDQINLKNDKQISNSDSDEISLSKDETPHEFKNSKSPTQISPLNQLENEDNQINNEDRISESKYEYSLYFFLFVIYQLGSFILPTLIGVFYFKAVFLERFVNYGVRSWNMIPFYDLGEFFQHLQDPIVLIIYLTSPLVFIILYLLRQLCSAFVVKFYYWIFNKIQKRQELINATYKNVRDVNIYHTRNFMLRIIKWQFSKGLFPWLTTSMFHFIGSNKIGKDVVIEDSFICSEYLEMKDNSYIGQHSIVSSNLVEGLYGALTVKKVKIGENSVFGAFSIVAPGVELGDNSQYLPMSGSTKFTKLKSGRNYWGLPAAKLSNKRFAKFIQLPEELNETAKQKESINTNTE